MLNVLTSFRFIAALLVFVWHTHIFAGMFDVYQLGYVGVGFFYLLSGFILTYVYFFKLRHFNIGAIKKFYFARVAKLYPVHILTFIIAIPLYISSVQVLFPEHTTIKVIGAALSNLTLIQAWFPTNGVHFSFNGVAWSISVELFYYALFPFLILLIARYRSLLTIKRIVSIMIVLWVLVTILFLTQQSYVDDWKLYIFPLARLVDFVIGILLGMIFIQAKQSRRAQRLIETTRFTRLEVASVLVVIAAIAVSPLLPQSLRFGLWMMPFLVCMICIFSFQRGLISKMLSYKPFVFLGEISFSFYMIHQLIIRYVTLLGISDTVSILLSLSLSIGLSSVLYLLYEEPLRLKLRHFLETKFVKRPDLVIAET